MTRPPLGVMPTMPLGPASALANPLSTSSLTTLSHNALSCGSPSGSSPALHPTSETSALPTPTPPLNSYNATKNCSRSSSSL
jgi:hypothetical protein